MTIIIILIVQTLQILMELESQYGALAPHTLVIDDILTFMSDVSSHQACMPELIIAEHT